MRVNPRVNLLQFLRAGGNFFTLPFSVISRDRGFIQRALSFMGVKKGDRSSRLLGYVPQGQFSLNVFGEDYVMDIGKWRYIGTGPGQDLPVSRKALAPIIENVLLEEYHVELETTGEAIKFKVNGDSSVLVFRGDRNGSNEIKTFVVHHSVQLPYDLKNGQLSLLTKEAGNGKRYDIEKIEIEADRFKIEEVSQSEDEDAFILEPNDTILIPLGRDKRNGVNKPLIWLPIVFNPQKTLVSDQKVLPAVILPPPMISLKPPLPERAPEVDRNLPFAATYDIDAFIARVEGRKEEGTTFLDLVEEEYEAGQRQIVIKMAIAAHAEKGRGRAMEKFQEDMALNWLLKAEAFYLITSQNNYRQVNEVGRHERVSILAVTQNGSLVTINTDVHFNTDVLLENFPEVADKLDQIFVKAGDKLILRANAEALIDEHVDSARLSKLLLKPRVINYMRISDRDIDIAEQKQEMGWIKRGIRKNEAVRTSVVTTSPIILLAIDGADVEISQAVSRATFDTFSRIDLKTGM